MPSSEARRKAYRALVGAFNCIAAQLNVPPCDRDANFSVVKTLRRRLLRLLHADKRPAGDVHPLFHQLQTAWDAWIAFEKREKTQPEGTAAGVGPKRSFRMNAMAFLLTYNSVMFQKDCSDTFERFLTWVKNFVDAYAVERWTATMERSMKSTDCGRVHMHLFIEFAVVVDWRTKELSAARFVQP